MTTSNRIKYMSIGTRGLKLLAGGILIGLALRWLSAYVFGLDLSQLIHRTWSVFWNVASKVGITIIVLIPLAIWAFRTWRGDKSKEDKAYDLLWIGSQAKEVGFIGTLIGVMLMFAALGVSLQQGDSGSIRSAIGGFSQAVISSLIGYIISISCKWMHRMEIRKEAVNA